MSLHINLSLVEVFYCNACGLSATTAPLSVYFFYNVILVGALLPLLATFGAVTNCLSLFIFSQQQMRHKSCNIYLGALAISDFFLVTTSVFMFTFEALRKHVSLVKEMYLDGITTIFPLGTIFQTTSIYLTVAAGFDGFVSTCLHAGKCSSFRRHYCGPKTALFLCLSVLLFAILYNTSHWFEVDVVSCVDEVTFKTKREVCATPLRQNTKYGTIYYMYMYTILMVVGPLVTLIILSCCIITATVMRKRRNSHKPATRLNDGSGHKASSVTLCGDATTTSTKDNKSNDTGAARRLENSQIPPKGQLIQQRQMAETDDDEPLTLIMVVILFIVCNALGMLVNFLEAFLPPTGTGSLMNYLVDGSNFLVVFNSSVNFIIYIKFDPTFKTILLNRVLGQLPHFPVAATNTGNNRVAKKLSDYPKGSYREVKLRSSPGPGDACNGAMMSTKTQELPLNCSQEIADIRLSGTAHYV